MTRRHAVAGGMTVLALACLFFVCTEKTDPLQEEVLRLQRATAESRAEITTVFALRRGASSAEASWELSTNMEWDGYRATLERAMPSGYVLEESGPDGCSFVTKLPGDTLRLSLEIIARASPLRLQAKFLAQPW